MARARSLLLQGLEHVAEQVEDDELLGRRGALERRGELGLVGAPQVPAERARDG